MRKTKKGIALLLLLVILLTAGCSAKDTTSEPEPPSTVEMPEAPAETEAPETPNETKPAEAASEQVASGSEMTTVEDVVEEGMVPVYGDSLKDGVYDITVDSSSSMFKIAACELIVENGRMTAVMHMGGTGYLYVYMGTGQEAVADAETAYIPYEEVDGVHTFTVPVEALDAGIDCTAFSKNKEKWYDRTLLFRADSLPKDAFRDGFFVTAESLGLADGDYTVSVTLEGGSGRASVESPARLRVENGAAYATIVWSSSNYDYMRIEDMMFDPIQTEGNSTFEISVPAFDRKVTVYADTTAMSTPHEIEYTLFFDAATLEQAQ